MNNSSEKVNESGQEKTDTPKRAKIPLPVILAIGCFGFVFIAGIIFSIIGKLFLGRIGNAIINKGIESQTGIAVDSGKEGFTLTDKKTGTKVNLGAQQIPENFPKDFPVYKNSKPVGSFSGSGTTDIWVMFSTPDSMEQVENFYSDKIGAWGGKEILRIGGSVTWEIEKPPYKGSLSVSREKDEKETKIMVILGDKNQPLPESDQVNPEE